MHAEVPVFVLCGTDACAIETLKEYKRIATEKGCDTGFLEDLQLLINDFEQFNREETDKVRLPD